MNEKSSATPARVPADKRVRDIRRATTRAYSFVQGRKANSQIIRNLAPRKPAVQRYPHRIFAKFIRPACAHGSSPLLHMTCSKERHQTATDPMRPDMRV